MIFIAKSFQQHPISNINSVSITASHVNNSDQIVKNTERQQSREETQTPAQRQAAAKLALRKQLEKTLLQVKKQPFRYDCYEKCIMPNVLTFPVLIVPNYCKIFIQQQIRSHHRNHLHQNFTSYQIQATLSSFIYLVWNMLSITSLKIRRIHNSISRSVADNARLTLRPFGNGRSKVKLVTQHFKILQVI